MPRIFGLGSICLLPFVLSYCLAGLVLVYETLDFWNFGWENIVLCTFDPGIFALNGYLNCLFLYSFTLCLVSFCTHSLNVLSVYVLNPFMSCLFMSSILFCTVSFCTGFSLCPQYHLEQQELSTKSPSTLKDWGHKQTGHKGIEDINRQDIKGMSTKRDKT